MVEQRADRSGQALGPYQLIRLLGTGGFGEVYEADHRLLQQKRAIKLLLEHHFHDPNQRERFLREARTLATLEHPNILPVLEVGEQGSVLYLVMPFYRRGTLNDLLKQCTTTLPLTEVERFLAQMCAAVGYAHARHIAHLDLKPENMLLHEDGRLVLSDFGLAHLIKHGRLEAGSSASWGTPYYMAPEQIRGEPELHSDLYALGVILYQLLTNQRPFTGTTPEAVMMKHLLEPPPLLRTVFPEAPAMLELVLQKALEKKPEDRYATAEGLLADFRAATSNPLSQPTQPPALGVFSAHPPHQMSTPAPMIQVPPEHTLHAAQPATGGGCEIKLSNGHNCGVTTQGRCATCGHAFCLTHQARSSYGGYVDWCLPCQEERQAAERKKQEERDAVVRYFTSGAARADLLASGIQPVEISWVKGSKWKEGFLGLGGHLVDEVVPVGRGWLLGGLKWENSVTSDFTKDVSIYLENCSTVLMDLSNDSPNPWYPSNWYWRPLAPVQAYLGGYANFGCWPDVWAFDESYDHVNGWIAATQAVRCLTGKSN